MTSDTFVSTFEDNELFGFAYFYTYGLVIIAMLFGATYFALKPRLYHTSHKTLDDIGIRLGLLLKCWKNN